MAANDARLRVVVTIALLATFALAAGCWRHPFDAKIAARSDLDFSMWLSHQAGTLTAADQRDLTDALQIIKFGVMTDSPGLAAAEFRGRVYAEIYGRSVREVLLRSIEYQGGSIAAEIKNLEDREESYRHIDATALSPVHREFLEGFNARMAQRRADLQRLEERKSLVLAHP